MREIIRVMIILLVAPFIDQSSADTQKVVNVRTFSWRGNKYVIFSAVENPRRQKRRELTI